MSPHSADLAHRLRLIEQRLRVIEAIDRLRDSNPTLETFLSSCVTIIDEEIRPDLCLLTALDDEGKISLRVAVERWRPEGENLVEGLIGQALARNERVEEAVGGGLVIVWPLSVNDERLGALVLGRASRRFRDDEMDLLGAVVAQIDSALKLLRTLHQLYRRQRELETIYYIDHLIDTTPDFDAALYEVLQVLSLCINAELSFIMLYTLEGNELELRAASHEELTEPNGALSREIRALARQTVEHGAMLRRDQVSDLIGSYIGVPLILRDQVIGVFGGANRRGGRIFGSDEASLLRAIASQMDTAVFEDREQQHIRQTFARYVSPAVVDLMLRTPNHDYLTVSRRVLTMLFSDMRGFTTISQQLPPDVVGAMLNEHLAAMTEIIRDAGGTVDKFVGDEVVAFWGAPLAREDHALVAVTTAIQMQRRQVEISAGWRARGLPEVAIGIGIGTGEVVVGNIGSPQMMNYTAIGADVNLAARLCSAAGPGQILMSESTYALVQGQVSARPVPPLALRHIDYPVQAFEVVSVM